MVRRGGDNGRAGGTGSDLTRARILDATLQCIRDAGIVGASARAIARTGGFNQASIYYHFGSINDAVLAAVRELGDERAGRYRDRLSGVSSLAELVRVAVELHREDVESGTLRVMAQVMAGAAADEPFGEALGDLFDPWLDVVVEALEQFAGPGGALAPLRQVLPLGELGYAISALFVGVETMRALRSQDRRAGDLFGTFERLGGMVEVLLPLVTAGAGAGAALPGPAPAPWAGD